MHVPDECATPISRQCCHLYSLWCACIYSDVFVAAALDATISSHKHTAAWARRSRAPAALSNTQWARRTRAPAVPRNTQWARLTPSGAAPRHTHARAHTHTHTHTHTRRTRATTAVSTIPRILQAQARVCGMLVETARHRSPAVRTQVRVSRLRPHAGKMSGLSSSHIDHCSHLRVINASHRCESYGIKKKRSHVACTRGVVFANCVANLYL
mmetsp:Transcript_1179/g.1572  ORF Transcript_1179/g.1572 Transcript_1179/m.1572 type:complete len:212 (+) Transcript_1179:543-1178(+)